jgi:hypothetical protein
MIDLHMRITTALPPELRIRVHHALAPGTIAREKARIRESWTPYKRYADYWTCYPYEQAAYDLLDEDPYLDARITAAVNEISRELAQMGVAVKSQPPMWYMVAVELRNERARALNKQLSELNGLVCRYLKDLLAWTRKYKRKTSPTVSMTQSKAALERFLTSLDLGQTPPF